MTSDIAYRNYWQRKQLLSTSCPHFSVVHWWESKSLCEVDRIILEAVRDKLNLLDVGAGDLRVKNKLLRAGYQGNYETQDPGYEYEYDYKDLSDVQKSYDAILCLDVLEHLECF